MKNLFLALTVSVLGLTATYAQADDVEVSETPIQIESNGEFGEEDKAITCTVAMVNRANYIVRRYHGYRNFRTFRCQKPMNQCRRDLRWVRVRGARCVELR